MGAKSLKIHLKNDRVEHAEQMMMQLERTINANVCRLGHDLQEIQDSIELIYEEMLARTIKGRWERIKKLVGRKK